jgi:uncharacterized SAM-binding protein YcdF (DUF218 family)
MKLRFAYFHRALILLPLLIAGGLFFLNIGDWLTASEEPEKADLIVCLNGSKERIKKAAELYNEGGASHILVSSSSMRRIILAHGVPETAVFALSGTHNSTYEEARHILQFMGTRKVQSAVVVSDGYHLYRARWTFETLKDSRTVQFIYTAADQISENRYWWRDKTSRKFVLTEIPKVVYYWIGHGLLGIEKDPRMINAAESWYNKFLDYIVSASCNHIPIS